MYETNHINVITWEDLLTTDKDLAVLPADGNILVGKKTIIKKTSKKNRKNKTPEVSFVMPMANYEFFSGLVIFIVGMVLISNII